MRGRGQMNDLEDISSGGGAHPVEECTFAAVKVVPWSIQIPPPWIITFKLFNYFLLQ